MSDINTIVALGMITALTAALVGIAPGRPQYLDLRISRAEFSQELFEIIPGMSPAKAVRIRELIGAGRPLNDAIAAFLSSNENRRFSNMLKENTDP